MCIQSSESVSTPVFAAHSVVHKEESVGIIFLFGAQQSRVIGTPERLLPFVFEKVALRNVGTRLRHHFSQCRHRAVYGGGIFMGSGRIRLVTGNSRVHGATNA